MMMSSPRLVLAAWLYECMHRWKWIGTLAGVAHRIIIGTRMKNLVPGNNMQEGKNLMEGRKKRVVLTHFSPHLIKSIIRGFVWILIMHRWLCVLKKREYTTWQGRHGCRKKIVNSMVSRLNQARRWQHTAASTTTTKKLEWRWDRSGKIEKCNYFLFSSAKKEQYSQPFGWEEE